MRAHGVNAFHQLREDVPLVSPFRLLIASPFRLRAARSASSARFNCVFSSFDKSEARPCHTKSAARSLHPTESSNRQSSARRVFPCLASYPPNAVFEPHQRPESNLPASGLRRQHLLQLPKAFIIEILFPITAERRRLNKLKPIRMRWVIHRARLIVPTVGIERNLVLYRIRKAWPRAPIPSPLIPNP
jgi:hypothetical protein